MTNRSSEVEAWLAAYENPLRGLLLLVREAILDDDPVVMESIKWQASTFMFRGNIASFFPKSRKNVTLMFHTSASISDPLELLAGSGAVSRVARFSDEADFSRKRPALEAVIRAWIESKR